MFKIGLICDIGVLGLIIILVFLFKCLIIWIVWWIWGVDLIWIEIILVLCFVNDVIYFFGFLIIKCMFIGNVVFFFIVFNIGKLIDILGINWLFIILKWILLIFVFLSCFNLCCKFKKLIDNNDGYSFVI